MRYALIALAFLVLTVFGIPSFVFADAQQPTFSFNDRSESVTFSGGTVSIKASFPEEVYVTRLYICEVSESDCTGSNYTRRFDINATTTEAIKEWDGKNSGGLGPAGGTEFLVTVRYYDYSESSEAFEVDSPITITLSEELVVNSLTHGSLTIEEGETYRRSDFTSVSTFWTFNFYSPIEGPNIHALYFIFKGTFGDVPGESAVSGENYTYTNQRWRPGNNIIGKTMSGIDPLGGFDAESGTYSILLAKSNNPSGVAEWFFSGGASGTEPEIHDSFTFEYLAEDVVEDLGSITSLSHGGVSIAPNAVIPIDTTFSETNYWTFTFSWPNSVTNLNAMFLIFRGEIGALDGDPVEGENYDTTNQSWAAGDNVQSKSLTLASFANGDAPEGKYTAVVFEKNVKDQSIDTDEFATWFFTDGEEGKAPLRYRTMTFTYGRHLEECCSSVVFFPGIQGGVLKSGSNTFWPSDLFGADLPKLALNEDGSSKFDIYVDGILNTYSIGAFSFDVYQPFTDFMDALVANDADDINIRAWHPFPYDWRYSPEQVIAGGVTTVSGVVDVLDAIEEYAYDSATGKVILVGHSMGGLFGKAVIKALEDEGKADLVESFVMVGTPQLGTPQAAASLLHGFSLGTFRERFIALQPDVVRAAALTIPSAYNLLPSSEYFSRVSEPAIVFDENSSFTKDWRDLWGTEIATYLDFFAFVTGGGVARIEPAEGQTRIPAILDPNLTFDANTFHDTYDTYDIPDGIRTVEIGGWGLRTIKGLKYKTRHFRQQYESLFTKEGDNTVVYPSALFSADESYFLNLDASNENVSHISLLSSGSVQSALSFVIKQLDINDVQNLSAEKPLLENVADQLLVSSHSPVFFGAYDEEGNFTGIDPDQNYSEDLMIISKEIPGSDFIVVGENQYIFLPKEGTYTFVYFGHDDGLTTIEISNVSGDDFTQLYTFTDIDTASTTQARFSISINDIQGIVIEVDYDGDDTYELEVFSDQEQSEPVEEEPAPSSGGGGGSPAGGGPTNLSGNNPFEFIVTFTPPQSPAPTQSSNNTPQPSVPSTASNPSSVQVDTQTVTPAPTPTTQTEQSEESQDFSEEQPPENREEEGVTTVALNNTEQLATAAQRSWYDWLITMILSILQWIKNFILNLF